MDDEKFTAKGGLGFGLEGDELEKARYKALGDIYTKYGDADKGLAVRQSLANLEAKERENTLNAAILDSQIKQQGILKELLLKSNIGNIQANTADTKSQTARRDKLVGGEVDAQNIANEGGELANIMSRQKIAATERLVEFENIEDDIITLVNSDEYRKENNINTVEDAQAATIRLIENAALPPERKATIIKTINQ